MKRKGIAVWEGGLKSGKGNLSTESQALAQAPYSFGTRFESDQGKGTNPEELIGAAHAGCFSMALSGELEKAGIVPEKIETTATVTLAKTDIGWSVTEVHLDLNARIAGLDGEAFTRAAESAKANCPISRLLNAKITLSTHLIQTAKPAA